MAKRKPAITAAMIVRDGGQLLRNCLASFREHVDDLIVVDTGSLDDSKETAREFGARIFDFTWVDDFAAARNESWRHIKTPWALWVDHDDELIGAQHLPDLLKELEGHEDIIGTWNPYWYSRDGNGNVNTVHVRERIVRMSVGWHWEHRVHEVLTPLTPGRWYEDKRVIWDHKRPPNPQTARNLKLLFLEYADNPSPRTTRAIGDQYFAGAEWAKAIDWYERFYSDTRALLPERWQTLCYAARAHRFLGQFEEALGLSKMAIEMMPYWGDGYLQMASVYGALGEWGKAAYWAEHSKKQEPSISFLIHNPVEENAEADFILHMAYAAMERYDKALECAEAAFKWLPDNERLTKNIGILKETVGNVKKKDAFLSLAKTLPDRQVLHLWRQMDGVAQAAEVRDVAVPLLLKRVRRGTQPEVTIFCGQTLDSWTAKTPGEKGIGGSETAVVEIAKRLVGDGFRTLVYNDCGTDEGIQDGVAYIDWRRWRPQNKTDIFVAWRMPYDDMALTGARGKWLWLHDLNKGDAITAKNTACFNRVFGVSPFHADYLRRTYPFMGERVGFLNNGVNLERFQQQAMRKDFKVAWTSSPDRGLVHLLAMWPHIVQMEPAAELHIFYGWENIDKAIAMGYQHLATEKELLLHVMEKQPTVKWRGRVNQNDLAKELLESQVWAYPTSFVETFCIGAVEAMAAGCNVVSSSLGNIPNIIGDAGLLVPGHAQTESYQKRFTGILMAFLADVQVQMSYRAKGPERAQEFTWDRAYAEHWKPALTMALEPEKVAA